MTVQNKEPLTKVLAKAGHTEVQSLFVEYPIIKTFCSRTCKEDKERQYCKQKRVLVLIPEFTVTDKKSNIGHRSNNQNTGQSCE